MPSFPQSVSRQCKPQDHKGRADSRPCASTSPAKLEAIFVYDAHVQATDDPVAKRVIADIRDEEKAHVGG